MIRIFTGLEIDPETRAALAEEVSYLKASLPEIRWTDPESFHMTMKFIGDIPEMNLPEILEVVDATAGEFPPFSLQIADLGCFPDLSRPRIVWAGCGQGSAESTRIAAALEKSCTEIGYRPERRPFRPHLTIGRVRHPRDAEGLEPLLEDASGSCYGTVDIDSLVVFMSHLKRGEPIYTPMHHAELCG